MGLAAFAAMIVLPILEISVFIVVGRSIGLWPTLAGIVLSALIGTAIIRHQGTGLIATAKKSIAAGEAPVGEVLQGLALLLAGALMILPGFITDTFGFLLLIPALRRRLTAALLVQAKRRAEMRVQATSSAPGTGSRGRPGAGVVIEGEWQQVAPTAGDTAGPAPGRGWGRPAGPDADVADVDELPPEGRARG